MMVVACVQQVTDDRGHVVAYVLCHVVRHPVGVRTVAAAVELSQLENIPY